MDLKKLFNMLILHEGLKLKPYTDTVGKLTIGVGHNLTDKGLSQAQVMGILTDDVNETIAFLSKNVPVFMKLDDVRQRALADMAFNLMGKLLDFKRMIAALEAKDWNKAADELLNSDFARQTGQRAKDLAAMIRTGVDNG